MLPGMYTLFLVFLLANFGWLFTNMIRRAIRQSTEDVVAAIRETSQEEEPDVTHQ